jgi:hypothetical protein
MVIPAVAVFEPSVAVTVTDDDPITVVLPLMLPVFESNVIPVGSAPEVIEYVGVPRKLLGINAAVGVMVVPDTAVTIRVAGDIEAALGSLIVIVTMAVAAELPSLAETVTDVVPTTVEFPLILPVPVSNVKPVGKVPLAIEYTGVPEKLLGVNPAVGVMVVPETAVSVDVAGAIDAPAATTIVTAAVALVSPDVPVTVIVVVPIAVGVPEIRPVVVLNARPAGNVPAYE